MKKLTMRGWGLVAIALAVIGSVTSYSLVRAGGTDGATYLIVNIALAVTGVVLLVLAARSRSERKGDRPISTETSHDATAPVD